MRKIALVLLLLVILPVAIHKPTLADRTPPYEIKYHTYEEISQLVLALNSSPYVDVKVIGYSVQGKPIYAIRISTDLSIHKPVIARIFNQHAREYITGETALFLAYYLDALLKGSVSDDNASAILSKFEIVIIPVANPDGHDIALLYNERQRKNAEPIDEDGDGLVDEDPPEDANGDGYIDIYYSSTWRYLGAEGVDNDNDGMSGEDRIGGVDPNRNRPRDWGEAAAPWDETYPGPKPLSEPEVRAIYQYLKSLGPVAVFDIHSGIKALLYPPGTEYGSTTIQEIYNDMVMLAIRLGRQAMQSINLYPAYGTLEDTGYFDLHGVSITLEIFGNRSRPAYEETSNGYRLYGVKRMFNPMPSKMLEAMRDASEMILGCSYIVYEHSFDKPEADVTYKLYGETLNVFVEAKYNVIREAFALLIGENMTRYIPMVDTLDGKITGSINIDTAGLRDGNYTLIVFYHSVSERSYKAFKLSFEGIFHDSNGNGIDDERENARPDNDSDGLSYYQEYLIGSNPNNSDTDFDGIADDVEYSISLLAIFRGSGFDDISYLYANPKALFLNSSEGVFVEVIGYNRSIEYSGDSSFFGTNDVAFAFYDGSTIAIVAHYDNSSEMFYWSKESPTGSEKSEEGGEYILIIPAIIAIVVLIIAYLISKRGMK